MGSAAGVKKAAAARIGLSVDAYLSKLSSGELWCTRCKVWHPISAFGIDLTRGSGKAAHCIASRRTGNPKGWHGKSPINQATGRPGPKQEPARDDDRRQARHRVNLEVRSGRIPRPNDIPCTDCGHIHENGDGGRHEYDHYLGYSAEHHMSVQAVCSKCHASREQSRGVRRKKAAGRLLDGVQHDGYPEVSL